MNLKLTQKNAISNTTLGVSAAGGLMVGKGVMGYVPAPMKTAPAKLIIGVGFFALASAISGSGALVDIAKGISLGVGAQQSASAISDFITPTVNNLSEGKTKDFLVSATSTGMAGVEGRTINLPSHVWDNAQPQGEQRSKVNVI